MKVLVFILSLFTLTYSNIANATHATGGYFEYECLGDYTYRVKFYLLRDCNGVDAQSSQAFEVSNVCGINCGVISYNAPRVEYYDVDFGCGNGCSGGSAQSGAPSYQIAVYAITIQLQGECSEWRIGASVPQRNTVDYAFATAGTAGVYYNYCTINNENGLCSSSAKISGLPFAIGCNGYEGASQYSITNIDGDIHSYNFVEPTDGDCLTNAPITHTGGTTAQMPVPSTANFTLLPNGEFSFNPTASGDSYFAIEIAETDMNGVQTGTIRLDGLVYVVNNCGISNNTITFTDWVGGSSNILEVSEVDNTICGSMNLIPNGNNESINSVSIVGPNNVTLENVTYNQDGSATAQVCIVVPPEYFCSEVDYNFRLEATTDASDCFAYVTGSGYEGHYIIRKVPGLYCPQNLFLTNRNQGPTGQPLPIHVRADERIWVGDDMPLIAPPPILANEGIVYSNNDFHAIAGVEVILPSCQTGNSCVTITGITTIEIDPSHCSANCPTVPLSIWVEEKFSCYNEKLIAHVTGDGPFTFTWVINNNVYTTTSNTLNIYQIISQAQLDGQNVLYSVIAQNAVGESVTTHGYVWGTNKFYNNIRDNTIYIDYPETVVYEDGYYYHGNVIINQGTGETGIIYDGVNFDPNIPLDSPPYYGATEMEMTIRDAGGQILYQKSDNLEGGTDWSIDNFSYRWNGHLNNDPNADCALTATGANTFNYRLIAKNCLSQFVPNPPEQSILPPPEEAHVENSIFTIGDYCHDDPYTYPVVTTNRASGTSGNVKGSFKRRNLEMNRSAESAREVIKNSTQNFQCFPNPTNSSFVITGDLDKCELVVLDPEGAIVLTKEDYFLGDSVDISKLANGIYTIILKNEGENRQILKLTKI